MSTLAVEGLRAEREAIRDERQAVAAKREVVELDKELEASKAARKNGS